MPDTNWTVHNFGGFNEYVAAIGGDRFSVAVAGDDAHARLALLYVWRYGYGWYPVKDVCLTRGGHQEYFGEGCPPGNDGNVERLYASAAIALMRYAEAIAAPPAAAPSAPPSEAVAGVDVLRMPAPA